MSSDGNKVTFTLSQGEYVAAGKLSLLTLYKRPSGPIALFGGVAIALLAIGVVIGAMQGQDMNWLLHGLVLAGVAGSLALSYFVSVPASYRRNYAYHKHLHEPRTWSWDSSGFDVRTENSYSRLQWADIVRFSENRKFILFYPMPRLMHILPKRTLTAAQIDELRSFASPR